MQAQPDAIADFYRGKTVNVLIGVGVGGEYDIQARLVARHIGKHIPGNPTVVAQNMTGAGGLRMINYLYNVAAKDGTYIGMIANAFPAMQAVGASGVQFDAGKMQWIGSIAPVNETLAVWHTTGVKTHRRRPQARDRGRRLGARRHHLHLSADDERAARHQVQDRHRLSGRQRDQPRDGARRGRGAQQHLVELEGDQGGLAQGEEDQRDRAGRPARARSRRAVGGGCRPQPGGAPLIELVVSGTQLGRPLATNAAPPERVAALRAAYAATMKDPEFLAEAKTLNFEINPVLGEPMQRIVEKVLATPKEVAAKAKGLME